MDDLGGEQVFRPFVLILTFVILGGLVLAGFSQMFFSSANSGGGIDDPENILGLWDYEMYTPITGYNITNSSILNYWPEGERGNLSFDSGDKWVYIVRNNKDYDPESKHLWEKYKDFIGVKRKADDLQGGKVYRYVVPLERFQAEFDADNNQSRIGFALSGSNYTIFIKCMDNNTNRIWWNNYTLFLGRSYFQSGHVNFLQAIKMIMTGDIPNFNPQLSILIAVIVDVTIIFVAYTMVSRIIPFISGG